MPAGSASPRPGRPRRWPAACWATVDLLPRQACSRIRLRNRAGSLRRARAAACRRRAGERARPGRGRGPRLRRALPRPARSSRSVRSARPPSLRGRVGLEQVRAAVHGVHRLAAESRRLMASLITGQPSITDHRVSYASPSHGHRRAASIPRDPRAKSASTSATPCSRASWAGRSTRSTSSSSPSSFRTWPRRSGRRGPTSRSRSRWPWSRGRLAPSIFGLIADRYGRRLPLMLNVIFYAIISVLSGLAPELHDLPHPPPAVRHRHGRRVGCRRVAGARVGVAAAARAAVGPAAGRLRDGQPARRAGVPHGLRAGSRRASRLRVARDVLPRRRAGAAVAVHPREGQGIRGVARTPDGLDDATAVRSGSTGRGSSTSSC